MRFLLLLLAALMVGCDRDPLLTAPTEAAHSAQTLGGRTFYVGEGEGEYPSLASLPPLEGGDAVLLRAGGQFAGRGFDPSNLTGAVRFGRYGEGADPVLTSPLSFYNLGGITIERLSLIGPGDGAAAGLQFYTDRSGRLPGIVLRDVRAERWLHGIRIGSWAGDAGWDGIAIHRSETHRNLGDGLQIYAEHLGEADRYFKPHRALEILNARSSYNAGRAGRNEGFGIIASGVVGGTIRGAEVWENGAVGGTGSAGPFGIMIWASEDLSIESAYAHHNKSAGVDGGGLDIDGDCNGCSIRNSRTHDNMAAGYFMAAFSGSGEFAGNVIENNVSERDGQKNSPRACISVWRVSPLASWEDNRISGNECVLDGGSSSSASGLEIRSATRGLTITDNTVRAEGGRRHLDVQNSSQEGLVLDRNHYLSAGSYRYRYGPTEYASLAALTQATGHEAQGREGVQAPMPPPPDTPPPPPPPSPPPVEPPPPPPPPPVADGRVVRVEIAGPSVLVVGQQAQLSATAYNAAGKAVPATLRWLSEFPALASVSPVGVLTARKAGRLRVGALALPDSAAGGMWITVTAAKKKK